MLYGFSNPTNQGFHSGVNVPFFQLDGLCGIAYHNQLELNMAELETVYRKSAIVPKKTVTGKQF